MYKNIRDVPHDSILVLCKERRGFSFEFQGGILVVCDTLWYLLLTHPLLHGID